VRDERVQNGVVGRRPVGELAARESAGDELPADTIVDDHLQARAGAIAEDVDRAVERVDIEAPATHTTEAVEPISEVDGSNADEDLQVRNELKHELTDAGRSR
jgi:hypothetical protein